MVVARYDNGMSNAIETLALTPNTRVRMIGSRGFVGTFVRYYAPLPSGARNIEVRWDRDGVSATILENQVEIAE